MYLTFCPQKNGVVNVVIDSSLYCSDQEIVEYKIKKMRKRSSRVGTMDIWTIDLILFRKLSSRIPSEAVMRGKCTPEIWLTFKQNLLKAQEHPPIHPFYRKRKIFGSIPAQQSKQFLNEFMIYKTQKKWKQGQQYL